VPRRISGQKMRGVSEEPQWGRALRSFFGSSSGNEASMASNGEVERKGQRLQVREEL
jgi:hypothetical protein